MSVIHEALKRAERERSACLVPTAAIPTASSATHLQRRRHWVTVAIGVSILLLAGVCWTLYRNGSRTAPLAPGAVTTVPSPSPRSADRAAVLRPSEPISSVPFPATPQAVAPTPAPAPAPAPTPAVAPAVAPAAGSDPTQLNSQAVASFREGRPEEARLLLEQALRLAPAMPEAHNNLGLVLQAQGHRTEAKEEYRRALALLPGYPEALNNLGLAASEEENQGEAIRSFEKALGSKPGYSSAHLNLAIVYDKLGKKSDAFYHYRKFLESAGTGEKELVRRVNDRLRR